jgi:hypothetical protein
MISIIRSSRLTAVLVMLNLVFFGLVGIGQTSLVMDAWAQAYVPEDPDDPGEEEPAMYVQSCYCVRTDPATGNCAEWNRGGCPRAKVQTCGVACP